MFWTCRRTVWSLITSAAAISRLLFPVASTRRIWSSRVVSPWAWLIRLPARERFDAGQLRRRSQPRRRSRGRPPAPSQRCPDRPGARMPAPPTHGCERSRVGLRAPAKPGRRGAARPERRERRPPPGGPPRARSQPSPRARRLPWRSATSSRSWQAARACSSIADGEHDLDVGGQQRRAPQRLGGLARAPGSTRPPPPRPRPARGAGAPALAAVRGRAGWPRGRPPRRSQLTPQQVQLAAQVRRLPATRSFRAPRV